MNKLKIIVFVFAVGLAGSMITYAYFSYTRVVGTDNKLEAEIHVLQTKKKDLPDPGVRHFENAMEQLSSGNEEGGRDALYELLRQYSTSKSATEAKRIIGEMNLDGMFLSDDSSLKKEYIVQPGDSLGLIARKNQTTIECIMRVNGMLSTGLQPGDHLFVLPLDFDMVVDASAKTVTLLRNQRFFKEYQALDVKLPASMKAPIEITINDKAAWVRGKRVLSTDSEFMTADKWLMGSKPGFTICALPQAKSTGDSIHVVAVKATKSTASVKAPASKKAANDKPGMESRDEDHEGTNNIPQTGVFLPREDVEELFTLIRTQTSVKVVR